MTATSSDKVWGFHEVSSLIGLYEGHPCLYNVKLKEYKDGDKKKAALREIATALETTEAEVTKKLNSLRSQYNRERAKLVSSAKSGSGIQDAQKSKVTWVHFESLQFLRDLFTRRRNRSNVQLTENSQADQEIEQFDDADEEAEMTGKEDDLVNYNMDEDADSDIDMESQTTAVTKKKSTKRPLPLLKDSKKPAKGKKREDEESQMFKRAVSVMETAVASQSRPSSAHDADDIFGQYIVAELKTIKDQYVKKLVKLKIQNLIFETEFSSFASVSNPVLPLHVTPHSMRPSGVQGYPSNFRLPSDQKMPSMLPSSGQTFSGTFRLPSDKSESSSSLQNLVLVAPENFAPMCSTPSRAINPSPVGSEESSLSNLSDSASQFSLP